MAEKNSDVLFLSEMSVGETEKGLALKSDADAAFTRR